MNAYEDRFLDVCLEEVLGDQDPPDLCEKILRTIHRESRGPADEDDQPLSHSASEEELTPAALTPAGAQEGARPPSWARAGKLPRWRRARNLVLVTLSASAIAAAASLAYQKTTERLQEEYAQGERASLLALGKEALSRAEEQLTAGEAALVKGDTARALEAAGRAQAVLEAVKHPLADPANTYDQLRSRLWKSLHDSLYTRSLVLCGRASTREGSEAAIARARALFKEALASIPGEDDPRRVGVLVALGEMLTAVGQLPQALESFEKALALAPEDWRARLARGRAQALQEDFEEATHDFTRALIRLGADAPSEDGSALGEQQIAAVLLQRSAAYRELGLLDKAMADARRAAGLGATWRARVRQAEVHVDRGERYAAIDLYSVAVGRTSGEAGPLLAMSEGLHALADWEGATEVAQKVLALEPSSPLALVLRAEAAELGCELALARGHADGALLQAGPLDWRTEARANRVLARLAAIEGDVKKANACVQAAGALDPYASDTLILRGQIGLNSSFAGQEPKDAERGFKQVLRRSKRSAPALRGLARLLLLENPPKAARAKRKVEEALSVDPGDPASLAVLSKCYLALASRKTPPTSSLEKLAARALVKSSRAARDPRRPGGWAFSVGQRAERLARGQSVGEGARALERARLAYRQAAWLNPFHAQARVALGRMALAQGSFSRARRHVDAALDADPFATAALVLDARLSAADPEGGLGKAKGAVMTALRHFDRFKARGRLRYEAELDLLAVQLGIEAFEGVKRGQVEQALERTREGFLLLRSLAPDTLPLIRDELSLLGRLLDACADAEGRAAISALRKRVQGERVDLQEARSELAARAKIEHYEARMLRKGGALDKAVIRARRAVRFDPRDSSSLALLSELYAASDKRWAALAYEVRHAYSNRLSRLDSLVGLLTELRREPQMAEGAFELDMGPRSAELDALLRVARVVARSQKIGQAESKEAFTALERVIDCDPSHPLPHLLAGYLAAGVQRNDYAAQELLFVSSVHPESARVLYLVGITLARGPADAREDALAIRCLRRALDAGLDWPSRAEDERDRARLRASPLWRHLRGE